jgi:hypothetical protein
MRLLLFITLLTSSISSFAETIEVKYASFYSHVKKLDDPDTDALRFAFGFKHVTQKRLCKIVRATILTEKQTLPLVVETNNRFTVPTDKILKMAKAIVQIEVDDNANQCDMSVQLETLPSYLKQQYTHDELLSLQQQYSAFFNQMGSFLSFLMPEVLGLVFKFDKNVLLPESLQSLSKKQGELTLTQDWLGLKESLSLPNSPLRITALLDK